MEALAPAPSCQTDCCWVCFGETSPEEPLFCPCKCPRPVHAHCLARWQLHSAGSREETACRFCSSALPDWKPVLTPHGPPAEAATTPTMSVTFNGTIHHVAVQGGPHGYACFIRDIRAIFGIADGHEMQLCFDCADPVTGQLVKLNGSGAYQAAVHCATISAVKRLHGLSRQLAKPGKLEGERLSPLDAPPSLGSPRGSGPLGPPTPAQRPPRLSFSSSGSSSAAGCEEGDEVESGPAYPC